MSSSTGTETELEWLLYQLWSKNTAKSPVFSFKLADTIILRQGCPHIWYFSSKEGQILRKNSANVTLGKINRQLMLKSGVNVSSYEDTPVAKTYMYRAQKNMETGAERMSVKVGYIPGKDLLGSMEAWVCKIGNDPLPHILQQFVMPKVIQNRVIKVVWQPSSVQMT